MEWGRTGEDWGGGGQFTSNLGPRWMGSHHSKRGIPSKLKGNQRGIKGEPARGAKEGFAPYLYRQSVDVYIMIV